MKDTSVQNSTGNQKKNVDKLISLVLDSAPLIKETPVRHLAEKFYTVPEVLAEIRDKKSRDYLAQLPFDLVTVIPSDDSLKQVVNFSKKTGDFSTLSVVDLKVLALTYMLEIEANGLRRIRTEPVLPNTRKSNLQQKPNNTVSKPDTEPSLVVSDIKIETDQTINGKAQSDVPDRANIERITEGNNSSNETNSKEVQHIVPEKEKSIISSAQTDVTQQGIKIEQYIFAVKENQEDDNMEKQKNLPEDINHESLDQKKDTEESSLLTKLSPNHKEANLVIVANEKEEQEKKEDEEEKEEEKKEDEEEEEEEDEENDDGEGEWITPKNIQKHKLGISFNSAKQPSQVLMKVGCMTFDYAMQNVLLQMRLNLLSIDGLRIKRINHWVLRCHACFKVTSNMEKQFCPSCGNPTLIRTSTSTDENGNVKYYLKKNFNYNLRGTKYSIPDPKSGHNSNNLILREDQIEYQRALKTYRRQKVIDIFDPDYIPRLLIGSGKSISSGPPVIGYGRKNPNESKRGKSKGKKRR
ncbi:hypothetical protein G9A89_021335 [Geosiphon pyriformis]|nr:hypothetical protein G9A89_021335 [Geosiphon pyriformis]